MEGALAVPLTSSQLDAASRLHDRMGTWSETDRALEALARRFPDFEHPAVLLKVAAVNQLYGTNLYAVARMAEHITRLMSTEAGHTPDLVDEIAKLPDGERPRRHVSFASKFAHFFIDTEKFPIYDSYALRTVRNHLGQSVSAPPPTYVAFVRSLVRLKELARLGNTLRELDRYLWLAGLHRQWQISQDRINVEAATLFASSSPDVKADLGLLSEQG